MFNKTFCLHYGSKNLLQHKETLQLLMKNLRNCQDEIAFLFATESLINSYSTDVSPPYPMKTSENLLFFKRYISQTLVPNGLKFVWIPGVFSLSFASITCKRTSFLSNLSSGKLVNLLAFTTSEFSYFTFFRQEWCCWRLSIVNSNVHAQASLYRCWKWCIFQFHISTASMVSHKRAATMIPNINWNGLGWSYLRVFVQV